MSTAANSQNGAVTDAQPTTESITCTRGDARRRSLRRRMIMTSAAQAITHHTRNGSDQSTLGSPCCETIRLRPVRTRSSSSNAHVATPAETRCSPIRYRVRGRSSNGSSRRVSPHSGHASVSPIPSRSYPHAKQHACSGGVELRLRCGTSHLRQEHHDQSEKEQRDHGVDDIYACGPMMKYSTV